MKILNALVALSPSLKAIACVTLVDSLHASVLFSPFIIVSQRSPVTDDSFEKFSLIFFKFVNCSPFQFFLHPKPASLIFFSQFTAFLWRRQFYTSSKMASYMVTEHL